MDHRSEIECQRQAFKVLSNGNDMIVGSVLMDNTSISPTFRVLINCFESNCSRCPDPEELIDFTSGLLRTDIRKLFIGEER